MHQCQDEEISPLPILSTSWFFLILFDCFIVVYNIYIFLQSHPLAQTATMTLLLFLVPALIIPALGSFYYYFSLPLPATLFLQVLVRLASSSSQVTHSSSATLSERLLWPLTLQISNISLCLIFFRAFITIRNALVQNFIFCLPPQLCKFHDDRNAVFTTAIQDCDTFEETFLSRLEKTCVIPQQTFLKLSMKHLRALLVGSCFFYFFFLFSKIWPEMPWDSV